MLTHGCVSSWSIWAESWNEAGQGDYREIRACKQVDYIFNMPVLLLQLLQGFQGRCFEPVHCWIKAYTRKTKDSWNQSLNKPHPSFIRFAARINFPRRFACAEIKAPKDCLGSKGTGPSLRISRRTTIFNSGFVKTRPRNLQVQLKHARTAARFKEPVGNNWPVICICSWSNLSAKIFTTCPALKLLIAFCLAALPSPHGNLIARTGLLMTTMKKKLN